MTRTIIKSIAFGLLLGTGFFFIPKFMIGLFIVTCLFGIMARKRMYMNSRFHMYQFAYAEKIRNMSEEEFKTYQSKIEEHGYHHCRNHYQQNKTTN